MARSELLAGLVEYHQREARPVWWEFFHRHEMTEEQLYDNDGCLAGLVRTNRPPQPCKRSTLFEYTFDPNQETKIHAGSECRFAHDLTVAPEIESFDRETGRIEIKLGPLNLSKLQDGNPPYHLSLIPYEYMNADTIANSIGRLVTAYAESGG